jgi:hypothetical protein
MALVDFQVAGELVSGLGRFLGVNEVVAAEHGKVGVAGSLCTSD